MKFSKKTSKEQKEVLIAIVCIAALSLGLWVDATFEWGQKVVNVSIWAFFFLLVRKLKSDLKKQIYICVLIATIAEVFFSLVLGVWVYQYQNLPFFVPPGHGIVYFVGVTFAKYLPKYWTWFVPMIFSPLILSAFPKGEDQLGLVLFAIFAMYLMMGKERKLYATMFLFSFGLEILGTYLGNWTWSGKVFGLTSANPPVGVGTAYCILDSLVLGVVLLLKKRRSQNKKPFNVVDS